MADSKPTMSSTQGSPSVVKEDMSNTSTDERGRPTVKLTWEAILALSEHNQSRSPPCAPLPDKIPTDIKKFAQRGGPDLRHLCVSVLTLQIPNH
ncbi:hypothetical protein B0I35DRAFT_417891 [Stachybotrys elegans]|uniref:Uncharacterized protein n=1 Tax=Stachybotrys elegans TaxID=80388 RepID=A0A8K0T5R9_9HYPO|nr:hypothetical protein B0I35DRAFT_417891 [Stachybotrys elegans]